MNPTSASNNGFEGTHLVCIDGVINKCPHDARSIEGQTHTPDTGALHGRPAQQCAIVERKP